MTHTFKKVVVATLLMTTVNAFGFQLSSTEFKNGGKLKDKHAACVYSKKQKRVVHGKNLSPTLKWKNPPKKTKSYVLVVTDPDVPVDRSDVNKSGEVIAKNARRQMVFHWIVTDIPSKVRRLRSGAGSLSPLELGQPVTKLRNKWASIAPYSDRVVFSDSYVGPCPPSNDQRDHRYVFTLFALGVPKVPVNLNQKQLMKFVAANKLGATQLIATKTNRPTG